MDRNLVLAIVLSIVIIVGFQFLFQTFSPPPPKKLPTTTESTKQPVPGPQARQEAIERERPAVKEASPASKPEPRVPTPTAQIGVPQAEEVQVKVDSLKYEAILSTKGGRIVSFKLKDYTKSLQGPELVNLFDPEGPDTAGPSIMFTRRDETFNDASLTFDHDSPTKSVTLNEAGAKKSITFRSTTSAGLTIAKTYTFRAENYDVGFSVTLTNASGEDANYLITFPWRKAYHGEEGERFSWNSAEILLNGQLKDYYFKDIKGDEEPSGQVEWAGLGDVYFFKALVFGKKPASKVTLFKPSKEGVAEVWVRYGAVDLPQGRPVEMDLSIYLGPKEEHALQAAGDNLSRALFYSNYKILDIVSEYLITFLRFCNSGFTVLGIKIPGTHNYGWDIILLTILIKILFIPLTHKSMKSMKRMQEIQPQIAKLKEKYKDDKAAINKATMELFREQKVNPLGGCWPMFLQLPVFVALYQALSYAIELRHASFLCMPSIYLCINDLAAPDPYYVTPILMGGTMVLQQWMTPSGGDPTQKKMMLMMPVVFTYLFLSFPSGLVLYWLVSNVLSIGQQLITNRMAT
jgi:YidC/Oxa1 family membrane protein insertase